MPITAIIEKTAKLTCIMLLIMLNVPTTIFGFGYLQTFLMRLVPSMLESKRHD